VEADILDAVVAVRTVGQRFEMAHLEHLCSEDELGLLLRASYAFVRGQLYVVGQI
jgi:hypothetical protein